MAGDVKALIGRIFQYINYDSTGRPQDTDAGKAQYFAAQLLIWELVQGERDGDFNYVTPPSSYGKVLDSVRNSTQTAAQKQAIYDNYNRIADGVLNHKTVPSFTRQREASAPTYQLTGNPLSLSLFDTNGVLGNYNFSCRTRPQRQRMA
jgi:hypothetical protein